MTPPGKETVLVTTRRPALAIAITITMEADGVRRTTVD